jgi:hypothetical protein
MTRTAYTAWQLARLADCLDPDSTESPGAAFLDGVEADYWERREDDDYDADDTPHEIADAAVPVYTHDLWATFVDLGAYQQDPSELGADVSDMTQCASVALYMIAARLVRALHDAHADDDTDDENEDA